jgi:aminopeptidase N
MAAAQHKSFRLPESRPHYPPSRDFHTSHVKIELALDFEMKRMSGTCTLEIEPIVTGLTAARFDACELDIREVTVDGGPVKFEYDGSALVVPLGKGGPKHTVRVGYAATPRTGVYFTAPDREHPEKEVQAWSHSEAEAARYWYPCHDHPGDRSTSELIVTVPREFRVISNGKLLSRKEEGNTATYHWREDTPHVTYLTSFVAGKFGEIAQEAQGIPLHYYFPESKKDDVLRYFGETPKIIEAFGELTGVKYPYAKYDQTTVQDFVAGGEENISATTLATNYYPDAKSEEDFHTTYAIPHQTPVNLVAHELAHQWFGDLVTCSDWAHVWLNEGFATYFQALYLERSRGKDEMLMDMQARLGDYFDEDENEYRRAIVERNYVWPDDMFDSHLYPKASSMLHELRFVMGEEPFFRGIASYLKSFSRSVADTDDFRKSMEGASGLQLQEFFEQSFYRCGHPELQAEYAWDEKEKTATLHVRQVQDTRDGTPIFKLPCEVVFYVAGERLPHRVQLDSAEQTLIFHLPAKPSVVEIDPRKWLLKVLKFQKSTELLLSQLGESQDSMSRAEAASDLGKVKSEGAVDGLGQAASKDRFWYVRACAYRALGEIGTPVALNAVLGGGVPKDRKVRRAFIHALGDFKGEEGRKILVALLKEDDSPYVRCEAALSLARSWPEGALPYLREAMKAHTVNETLAEACLAAMGKLKEDEVGAIIMESLPYGRPTRVRIGALKAIKERGRILDGEVPVLREILRGDPEFRVRVHLINYVIRPLEDRRFTRPLRDLGESEHDLRVKRKALEVYHELAAGAEASAAISKLRSEVEELKEKNAKLAGASA